MKNITLCGINARYSHTNLALRCLKYATKSEKQIRLAEFSINDRIPQIVHSIVCNKPDAVGFSCYIWNIEQVLKTASTVKRILPKCFILLGGPEVSYDSVALMNQHRFIDMIIKGQGETPFSHFMENFVSGQSINDTPSAYIKNSGNIIINDSAPPYNLNSLPFLYANLDEYKNKMIYYETSRGCPFGCAYCMSANDKMSFLPLTRVKAELEYFMKANVRQVKLVDRTFNFPAGRAHDILQTLVDLSEKYPQSTTNFHLEISACLLEDKTLALLAHARKNLVQLEIGIQSTHPATLSAVNRSHDMQKLFRNTKTLCRLDNIHVHVDLIAGLPCENYQTFQKSFNDAYQLQADMLQLGFLKVLKGAPMQELAKQYNIVYSEYAPYEVLSTHVMSYEELSKLHLIEHVVDSVYNTGHFKKALACLIPAFDAPFAFYEQFALYLDENGYFARPQKKQTTFEMLYLFAKNMQNIHLPHLKEALTFDWLCLEKPKSWPTPLKTEYTDIQKRNIRKFYQNKTCLQKYLPEYEHMPSGTIANRCFVCFFSHMYPVPTTVLFNYGKPKDDETFCQTINTLE